MKKLTKETKEKISMGLKRAYKEGRINKIIWNKGKKLSKEHRKKLSVAKKDYTPWNKGLKGINKGNTNGFKKGHHPWNKGKIGTQIGEKHWNWKGGITKENKRIRSTGKWKEWRKEVFKRDNYTCQECDKKGGYLHPHHPIPVKECLALNWKEEIFDIDNGVTLCASCHLTTEKHKGVI